jgi:hypothetical protein
VRVRFWIHAAVATASALLTIPAYLWWKDSILFVIGLSLFANFYAAVSALEAADDSAVLERLDEIERLIKTLQ